MILEVLSQKRLTIYEVSDLIGFQQNTIRTVINRLKEEGMIRDSGFFKRKYKVFEIPNIEYDTDNPYLDVSVGSLDTEILRKMLLPFVKRDITLKLSEKESDRVTKLFIDTYNEEGGRKDGK